MISAALPLPSDAQFAQFQRLIYREAGICLSNDKRALLVARLSRRIRQLELRSFGAYYRRVIGGDGAELVRLLDAIATNETSFFREPKQFELLADRICVEWETDARAGRRARRVRVWSAACSTGEEPYSLAMLLHDRLVSRGWHVEILASDLSTRALERARASIWTIEKADAIPGAYRRTYMLRGVGTEAGTAMAGPDIRSLVTFERINLRSLPLPARGLFDLILCRNMLIYFDRAARASTIGALLQHLAPRGFLFLGHAESLTGMQHDLHSIIPAVYQAPHPERGLALA